MYLHGADRACTLRGVRNQRGEPVIPTSDFFRPQCVLRSLCARSCVHATAHKWQLLQAVSSLFSARVGGRPPSHFGQHPNQTQPTTLCRVSRVFEAWARVCVCVAPCSCLNVHSRVGRLGGFPPNWAAFGWRTNGLRAGC